MQEKEEAYKKAFNQPAENTDDLLAPKPKADILLITEKMEINEKTEELRNALLEESVRKIWGEKLMDHLEETVGHLCYLDSPPIHIIGSPALLVDLRAPVRLTSILCGVRDVLYNLKKYIRKGLGPVPKTWLVRGDKILIPTAEILRLRMKIADTNVLPTKDQRLPPSTSKAAGFNQHEETSFHEATLLLNCPEACHVLFGGLLGEEMTNIDVSLAAIRRLKEKVGKTDKKLFFNLLMRRFPNYPGVLLSMGWNVENMPLSPEDLPEDLMREYYKVEVIKYGEMKEKLYTSAMNSGNLGSIMTILKALDVSTVLAKENAKKRKSKEDFGFGGDSPSWIQNYQSL